MDVYHRADNAVNSCPHYDTGFTQLLGAKPYKLSPNAIEAYGRRHGLIRIFQQVALSIFRSALEGQTNPLILHWLINETPAGLREDFHRKLHLQHFTLPVFFRTDEVLQGKIAEIQCPGSLWGELQLAFDYVSQLDNSCCEVSPATRFSSQLGEFLQDAPTVDHLLDNASAPSCMRYFIEKTRPSIKYWGIDRHVKRGDCNFIRSHSFFGLCASNDFRPRLARAGNGVAFDLPPHVLFDQKATLALPFWSETRELFSEEIRHIFAFTTPLLPTGIELEDREVLTLEDFAHRPRAQRAYYLKYAGSDVALNWGSKAVYRLSNLSSENCLRFLRECVAQFDAGHIWLLQREETHDDDVEFLLRSGAISCERLRAKFSGFYGPSGYIGALAMHRRHNKVHGQADTVISYMQARHAQTEDFPTLKSSS